MHNVKISLVLLQTSLDWYTWLVILGLSILFFFSNSFISMWLIPIFPTTSITFLLLLFSSHQRTCPDAPLSTSLLPVLDSDCWYKICPHPLSLKISLSSFTLFYPSPILGFSLLKITVLVILFHFIIPSTLHPSSWFFKIFSESKSCSTIFHYIKARLKLIFTSYSCHYLLTQISPKQSIFFLFFYCS